MAAGPRASTGRQREWILRECARVPNRERDGTARWSLRTLRRARRRAPDGVPQVRPWTILQTLWDAGYRCQKDRTWCHTGPAQRTRKDGTVVSVTDPETAQKKPLIECVYRVGEG